MAEERAAAQAAKREERARRRAERDERGDTDRERQPGSAIIVASVGGTAVFTLSAVIAATIGFSDTQTTTAMVVAVVVALALFAVGSVVFLVALYLAAQRSREVLIGVGSLFFLGEAAPASVRLWLMGSLAVQVVVAVATAAGRPFTSLAFGTLVPMFGLALAGLWGALHGNYPERVITESDLRRRR